MASLDSWLESVYSVQATLDELDVSHEERRAEVVNQLNTLVSRVRKRVKAGATTGDPVQDYVLLGFWRFGGEILERYRALAEQLAQHTGEFVLQYELKEKTGSALFPEVTHKEHLAIGVLLGGELLFPAGEITCRLPTGRYVAINGDARLWEGNLKVSRLWGSGSTVGCPRSIVVNRTQLRSFPGDQSKPVPRVQIVVGDEEVRDWFRERGSDYEGILEHAAKLLDHTIPLTEEELAELKAEREACLAQLKKLVVERKKRWRTFLEHAELGIMASREPLRRFRVKDEEVQAMVRRAVDLEVDPEEISLVE